MKISIISLSLALVGLLTTANAQERLELDKAKQYAQLTRQKPEALKSAPLQFKADLEHPVALSSEGYGGLLIPRAHLSEISEDEFGAEATAIGELWFFNLAPEQNGWAAAENKLDIVSLNTDDGVVKFPRCVLGVRTTENQSPVLMVYGKDKKPLLTVPILESSYAKANALDMTATADGEVTLSMGKYTASFKVAELILW